MVDSDGKKIEHKSYDAIVESMITRDVHRMAPIKKITNIKFRDNFHHFLNEVYSHIGLCFSSSFAFNFFSI